MLDIRDYSARRPSLRRPLALPIRILLATRGAPSQPRAYNVVGMVRRLLGRHGDERANKVLLPFIYAGNATDEQIRDFVESPWLDPDPRHSEEGILRTGTERTVPALRIPDFPRVTESSSSHERWDVVHFADSSLYSNGEPRFPLDLTQRDIGAGELRDVLVEAQCRLLILQVETELDWANGLAEWVVNAGGPSVLVVGSDSPVSAEKFFTGFYLGLLHNERLSWNARKVINQDVAIGAEVRILLHLSSGGDDEWALDPAVERALERLDRLQHSFSTIEQSARRRQELRQYQHAAHARAVNDIVDAARVAFEPTGDRPGPSSMLEELNWSRESGGVVPLSNAMERIEVLEQLESELFTLQEEEERHSEAPRVLNANFATADGTLLKASEPLRPEKEIELLVDIGPRWDVAQSIVSGHSEFPSEALPRDRDGHRLQVLFASDQFEPRLASGSIWLPAQGRSHPMKGDKKAGKSGPLALRLKCPALPPNKRKVDLHGRLSIYFENNLLQSAVVKATLAASGGKARASNAIAVDYVLTGGFRDVGQLERRKLGSSEYLGDVEGERIAVNMTLNDDGGGTHRIIIASAGQTASLNFDPLSTTEVLRSARDQLIALFWKRDDNGNPIARDGGFLPGLDDSNGKDFEAFQWDLLDFAVHGSKLFALLFNNVRPPDGQTAAEWASALRSTLSQPSLIQIANTGASQHVFPWALVYDFPLTAASPSDYVYCKSIREWEPEGGKAEIPATPSCPFGDHEAHENKICPYGFWGLRHIIEQPPSLAVPSATTPPTEPRREIPSAGRINLKAAFTSDAALDGGAIERHAARIAHVPGMHFTPPAATDWDAFRQLLDTTQILYFLCHGEFDAREKEPYLGIGLRDSERSHRVYASNLSQVLIKIAAQWRANAPLVLINGCHTANLEPGQIWSFVTSFVGAGASGVVGTEVSIRLPVATEAAETILAEIAGRKTVGDAIRRMRWLLANKRNLIGLAYTPYCLADLRLG